MTERLLQFTWQFQYFNVSELRTEQGEIITIVFPGMYNTNQGPDFLQAKIRIGNTLWAGNIELHIKTSDWVKHTHDDDPNYRNVILHIVWQNDIAVENSNMPILVLQDRVSSLLLDKYAELMEQQAFVPCINSLREVREIVWLNWKERLFVERMQRKSAIILENLLPQSNNHWEEVCWWIIARNFGSKVNADAFETVARSIPINILLKHKSSIHQLEALLFGQSGMLDVDFDDDYPVMLKREYAFLRRKYNLQKTAVQIHFLRMRPPAFPTIRWAQLAAFLHASTHLFSEILETGNVKAMAQLFDITANDYWHYHYRFDEKSAYLPKMMGRESAGNIIINAIAPLLFAYGNYHGLQLHKDKALEWLQSLPAEKNTITNGFCKAGVKNENAFVSQSLIELKTRYCDKKKCLECAIGNNLLKFAK